MEIMTGTSKCKLKVMGTRRVNWNNVHIRRGDKGQSTGVLLEIYTLAERRNELCRNLSKKGKSHLFFQLVIIKDIIFYQKICIWNKF